MKTITPFLLALVGFSHAALALDDPTPSPTPVYVTQFVRPGPLGRAERAAQRSEMQASAKEKAQARAQAQAERRAEVKAAAQARNAARAREKAQRQVAAQDRRESATAQPHATSDLMQRMGFSEAEIAAQKAREETAPAQPKPVVDLVVPAATAKPSDKPTAPGTP